MELNVQESVRVWDSISGESVYSLVYKKWISAAGWISLRKKIFKKKSTHTLTLSRIPKPSRDGDELVECSCCSWQTLMLVFSCICFSYSRTSSKAISAKAGGGWGQKPWTSSVRNTEGGSWWCHRVRLQGHRSSQKNEWRGFLVPVSQWLRWEDVSSSFSTLGMGISEKTIWEITWKEREDEEKETWAQRWQTLRGACWPSLKFSRQEV